MERIKVMPDHMSSGLWAARGANLDESYFEGALNQVDLMALKYWHDVWEFMLDEFHSEGRMSKNYADKWSTDGKALVESWNSKQDKFLFVYDGDYWR